MCAILPARIHHGHKRMPKNSKTGQHLQHGEADRGHGSDAFCHRKLSELLRTIFIGQRPRTLEVIFVTVSIRCWW